MTQRAPFTAEEALNILFSVPGVGNESELSDFLGEEGDISAGSDDVYVPEIGSAVLDVHNTQQTDSSDSDREVSFAVGPPRPQPSTNRGTCGGGRGRVKGSRGRGWGNRGRGRGMGLDKGSRVSCRLGSNG